MLLALDCIGADDINYFEKGNALLPDFGRGVVSLHLSHALTFDAMNIAKQYIAY